MLETDHQKIFAAYHRNFEYEEITNTIRHLKTLISAPGNEVRMALKDIVPDYQTVVENNDKLLSEKIGELSLSDSKTS